MDLLRRSPIAGSKMSFNWSFLVLVSSILATSSGTPVANTDSLCNPTEGGKANAIQCFCISSRGTDNFKSADCYINSPDTLETDESWEQFNGFRAERITFTNTRGIPLKYLPTKALMHLRETTKLDVRYAVIEEIPTYAFANISSVREITLSDNQIETLRYKAFANHPNLSVINLDKNKLEEINAGVFDNLPSLEKLFLTSNKISTIHDKAFIGLHNLKDLELDKNKIFTLTNDAFVGLKNLLRLELSYNSLEVIGDFTFSSLTELEYLNLEGNKIEVIDDYAFKGLKKLLTLSLAMNRIRLLDSVTLFTETPSLSVLNIKGNNMTKLEGSVMTPILKNFHKTYTKFDFEDNLFPCDCSLEWFIKLRDATKNENLKLPIDNLKCVPDAALQAEWQELNDNAKLDESMDESDNPSNGEYEYYDEKQLGGKLFYTDVRETLLNCVKKTKKPNPVEKAPVQSPTAKPVVIKTVTKATTTVSNEKKMPENRGVLVLTDEDYTEKAEKKLNDQQVPPENFYAKNDDGMSSDDPSGNVNTATAEQRRENGSSRVVGRIFVSIMIAVSLVFK